MYQLFFNSTTHIYLIHSELQNTCYQYCSVHEHLTHFISFHCTGCPVYSDSEGPEDGLQVSRAQG